MIKSKCVIAAILLSTTLTGAAQPAAGFFQLEGQAPKLFANRDYEKLNALYQEISAIQERDKNGEARLEKFFQTFADNSFNHGMPPSTDLVAVGIDWVSTYPDSVAAAVYLGRVTGNAVRRIIHLDRTKPGATENWAIQEGMINKALVQLERVRTQGATDAMWHATYLTLISLNGATSQRKLRAYSDALAKIPNPASDFFQSATNALDLRETKAFPELREMAALAAAKTSVREGMSMYAVVYITAIQSTYDLKVAPFGRNGANWPIMDTALSDLYQRYPSQDTQNLHPILACLAKDKARTAQLLLKLPADKVQDIWASWPGARQLYERCKGWALGPFKPTPTPQPGQEDDKLAMR
ncbi:hypothetical protein [Acidovorax sp.]|uniref:hypothetical protein n=1 Tax=Acidovorax sp. TaxID=1872122 RepID=UPI003D0321D8